MLEARQVLDPAIELSPALIASRSGTTNTSGESSEPMSNSGRADRLCRDQAVQSTSNPEIRR
jgi:hypothetical protein